MEIVYWGEPCTSAIRVDQSPVLQVRIGVTDDKHGDQPPDVLRVVLMARDLAHYGGERVVCCARLAVLEHRFDVGDLREVFDVDAACGDTVEAFDEENSSAGSTKPSGRPPTECAGVRCTGGTGKPAAPSHRIVRYSFTVIFRNARSGSFAIHHAPLPLTGRVNLSAETVYFSWNPASEWRSGWSGTMATASGLVSSCGSASPCTVTAPGRYSPSLSSSVKSPMLPPPISRTI